MAILHVLKQFLIVVINHGIRTITPLVIYSLPVCWVRDRVRVRIRVRVRVRVRVRAKVKVRVRVGVELEPGWGRYDRLYVTGGKCSGLTALEPKPQ